jgi:hypothetical protein
MAIWRHCLQWPHGRLHSHLPSWHPLPWTSLRTEGSPGPLGRPVLEGPALWLDLLLSLTRAPRKQLWQLARQVAWRTGRCPTFSRSGRTLARAGITPVAETAINFHSLSSCTDCVDKAAGGAFWAPPAEIFESEMQDLPMEPRLGLFASSRRANPSEMPTAGEVTVTDGEHRKVTGGGKERAIRVWEAGFRGLFRGRNAGGTPCEGF